MITGDQALTACHVASEVHIITKPALILIQGKNSTDFQWVSPDETEITSYRQVFFRLFNRLMIFFHGLSKALNDLINTA